MSTSTPTSMVSEQRKSQHKRKPPPSPAMLVDLELGDCPNSRYPPFDIDDPFASLTELRRRSRSLSLTLERTTHDLHHQATDTAPFDLPLLSPKAFPSEIQRRYTLEVALPGPLTLSSANASPVDVQGTTPDKEAFREDALARLSSGNCYEGAIGYDRNSVSDRSGDASAGRTSHQEHHRRYTHISLLFRAPASAHVSQNGRVGTPVSTKNHYIPRKASSLSYMHTPPLTPDMSGSSSSSLFDPASMSTSKAVEEDRGAIPPPPKSPTPSTQSFVKKLLTKRSAGILSPLPRRKESKDLPSLPPSPTLGAKSGRDHHGTLAIPFPRSSGTSMSDVTLPTTTFYSEQPKTTVSIIGASPQRSIVYKPLLPAPDRNVDGYSMAPETRLPLGADLDAGIVPPRKTKLFTVKSRSLLRSRVDLYETVDETGMKTPLPEFVKSEFREFAPLSSEQLLTAASLSVISESGIRVRFGDIWEKKKTVIIFVRHFRASACQDYVRSIASEVDVEALEKAGLKIVIVGMGSPSLITPYRQLTGTTFPIYTDPTLTVYHALGMTLRSSSRGVASEQGHYVASSRGVITFGSLKRTLAGATRLPLFERAGDTSQLGGEFVLGPGNECVYAHRMRTTRAHAPILDVVAASGVQTARSRRVRRGMRMRFGRAIKVQGDNEDLSRDSMEDEDAWMARRRRSLVRLRKKRQRRRAGIGAKEGTIVSASDSGDADTSAQTQADEASMDPKRRERFPVVEEEDEDFDEVDDTAFGVQ